MKRLWRSDPAGQEPSRGRTPPAPDTSAPVGYLGEREVETVYSRSKVYRTVIASDERGLYRVHSERWDTDDWDVGGSPHWRPYDRGASITDTLENARKLAAERLALVESPEPEQQDVEQ